MERSLSNEFPMPRRWQRLLIQAANGCVWTSVALTLLQILTGHAAKSGWTSVLVLSSLGYGMADGSIVCAATLFVLSVGNSVVRYQRHGTPPSMVAVGFALAYLLGAIAMIALPRQKRSMLAWPTVAKKIRIT